MFLVTNVMFQFNGGTSKAFRLNANLFIPIGSPMYTTGVQAEGRRTYATKPCSS